MRLRAAPFLVVVLAAACGSSHHAGQTTTRIHHVPIRFRAVLHAPTHHPRASQPWLYSVRVTNLQGRPIRARIRMQVIFGGIAVGKVDGGKTFTFTGTWREPKAAPLIWPRANMSPYFQQGDGGKVVRGRSVMTGKSDML